MKFAHIWTIEHFPYLWRDDVQDEKLTKNKQMPTKLSFIHSDNFPVSHNGANYNLFLLLCPNTQVKDSFVSLSLHMQDGDHSSVAFFYTLAIQKDSLAKNELTNHEAGFRILRPTKELKIPKFISHIELFNPYKGYLSGDILRIYCEITFEESFDVPVTISKSTINVQVSVNRMAHEVCIDNLSDYQNKNICIASNNHYFCEENHIEFNVHLWPNGDPITNTSKYVSVKWCLVRNRHNQKFYFISAQYQLALIDAEENQQIRRYNFKELHNTSEFTLAKYVRLSKLLSQAKLFLPKDRLKLVCELEIIGKEIQDPVLRKSKRPKRLKHRKHESKNAFKVMEEQMKFEQVKKLIQEGDNINSSVIMHGSQMKVKNLTINSVIPAKISIPKKRKKAKN